MSSTISNTDTPHIEIKNLTRAFDDRKVLDGISFKVKRGETLVILGGKRLREKYPPAPHHRLA